jgi:hypothetical protein
LQYHRTSSIFHLFVLPIPGFFRNIFPILCSGGIDPDAGQPGGARGFVDDPALLRTLAVALLLLGLVALPHRLLGGLLPERDLALLLKILLAHLPTADHQYSVD